MIRFQAELINNQIKNLRTIFDEGLREVIRSFVESVVQDISYSTPTGSPESQIRLYQLRQQNNPSLQTNKGLAANNWRVTTSENSTGILQRYGEPNDSIGVDAYNKLSSFKLGQTIYIVNNAPHINQVLTGKYHLPSGQIVNKQPLSYALVGIVQSGFSTFNEEINKLNIKLRGV